MSKDISARRILEHWNPNDVYEVTDIDKPVETMWGIDIFAFSREQVEGMLNGKTYWGEDGEYAHLFVMKDEKGGE